jgi:subtilisin family serine protease
VAVSEKGCRVAYGRDFVVDAYTSEANRVEDPGPEDCVGHGAHTTNIIDAHDKLFVGVALNATLGMYRITSYYKDGNEDVVAKIMNYAANDKMDIINLSLGFSTNRSKSVSAIITERLARRGIIVVAAMDNWATGSIWEGQSSATAPNAYAVAAFENAKYDAYTISIVVIIQVKSRIHRGCMTYSRNPCLMLRSLLLSPVANLNAILLRAS